MSRLASKRFCGLLLICGSVVTSGRAVDLVRVRPNGQPAAPAAAQEAATSTNAAQLRTKQLQEELLQEQLRKDLIGSLNIFSSKGSLRGVVPPTTRPPAVPRAQNKQIKQLMEGEKNVPFMTPDDLKEEQALEEVFKLRRSGEGKRSREELSFLGRYFESLDRSRGGSTNRSAGLLDSRMDESFATQDQATLPGASLFRTEDKLKDLFGGSTSSTTSPGREGGGIFFELFGVAELGQTVRTPAQKALLNEFKQLLETKSPQGATTPAAGAFGGPADPFSSLSSQGLQPRPTGESPFRSINPESGTRPTALSDLTAKAPARPNLVPAPPAESAWPPAATQTFPKRKF